MRVGLLGPLTVEDAAGEPIVVGGHRQRTLLALLAIRPRVVLRTDRLIDELWSAKVPKQPSTALQLSVFKLRRMIGADRITTAPTGYLLDVDPDGVDAIRFEDLIRVGRAALTAGRAEDAVASFDQALALWRDEPMGEFPEAPAAVAVAAHWRELRTTTVEDRFDSLLAAGGHVAAIAELGLAVADEPFRERLRAQLMIALYRSGRQAEALRAFNDARRTLADELGLDPGAALRDLQQAILDHDPALATAVPPSPATSGSARAAHPLIGRDDDLDSIRRSVNAAFDGHGGCSLVTGEAGIGKTRLASEIADAATNRGALVAWGRCHDGRGAPEFWPWIQVVRHLVRELDDDALPELLGPAAGLIAQIVPEVADRVPLAANPSPADPDAARFRLADALASFVAAVGRARPLVLVLDDVHWADPGSIQALTLTLNGAGTTSTHVIATSRTSDNGLGRLPGTTSIELAGLDRSAVASLVAERGATIDHDGLSTLMQRTGGNPFFLTEILKLGDAAAGPGPSAHATVPTSVRAVIGERVGRLPPGTVDTLTAAAIMGDQIDPIVLATMTASSAGAVLDRLQPALDADILVASTETPRRYHFTHGLIGESITSGITESTSARLHLEAARALERHHRDDAGPHLLEIAVHWMEASSVADIDEIVDAALRAARWAVDHVAHRQAEEQLRAALQLIATITDDRRRQARELEVLDQLSTILLIGAGYTAPGLPAVCDRMRQLSNVTDNRDLLVGAMWRLSIYYCTIVDIDRAIDLGEDLLARGQRESDAVITLTGHLALSTPNILRGQLRHAQRHLDAALDTCRHGGDDMLHGALPETPGVFARSFAGWTYLLLGDHDTAEALSQESIAVGERYGSDSYAAAVALCIASWVAAIASDAELAYTRSTDGIARSNAAGYDVRVFMMIVQGWATATRTDYTAGTTQLRTVSELMRSSGATMLRPFHFALLADAALNHGEPDDALTATDQGLQLADSTGERWGEAELRRLRAAALAQIDPTHLQPARVELETAIDIATAQHASTFLQRAVNDLQAITGPRPS